MSSAPVWTEDEVAYLRQHYDAGVQPATIGRALGRSRGAVKNKIFQLALVPSVPPPLGRQSLWTEANADMLRQGVSAGLTVQAIAAEIGVSSNQIRRQAARLQLAVPVAKPQSAWTRAADNFIRANYRRTMSAQQIADHLGKLRNAVIGRAHDLGLQLERGQKIPISLAQVSGVRS